MSDDKPSKGYKTDPTLLHKSLGVLALAVFLASYLIDMLPGYTVRPALAVVLAVAFLSLLGFGHIAGVILDLYGTGRSK